MQVLHYSLSHLSACLNSEVEKGVEAGKELPRKFLRLVESFQANHKRYVAFCEKLSNHVKIYGYERLVSYYPSFEKMQ